MKHLSEVQFECLDAISINGALCSLPDSEMGRPVGAYIALGSPRIGFGHPGWDIGVVNALHLMGLLRKSESGEYTITPRGEKACVEYRAALDKEALAYAIKSNPGKIILLKDYRK
jgi:hypothetical protein